MRIVILLMFSLFAFSVSATNPVTVSSADNSLVAEKTITKTDALHKTGFVKQFFSKVKTTYNKVAKFVKTQILDNISDKQLLTYAIVIGAGAILLMILGSVIPGFYFFWWIAYLAWLAAVVLFIIWLLRVL